MCGLAWSGVSELAWVCVHLCFFFFNDTATTEIYTLSLHDALPIYTRDGVNLERIWCKDIHSASVDRKSTRLNSSHLGISYAVFCLKKKNTNNTVQPQHKGCMSHRRYTSACRLV